MIRGRHLMKTLFSVITVTVLCAPSLAFGAASRAGETFSISGGAAPTKRRPDVAYDTTNQVYLVVYGLGRLQVAFVSGDGAILVPPFDISEQSGTQQTPRAAFSPDANGFLVTWLDYRAGSTSSVWGRLIGYRNGAVTALTSEFQIATAPGGAHSEMGPAVAYSTVSKLFLVTWMQYGVRGGNLTDVRGQRINNAGQAVGGEIPITANTLWDAEPSVAYNPSRDEFLVAWSYSASNNLNYIGGSRIQASTGSILNTLVISNASAYVTIPEVRYNTLTGQYIVTWYNNSPSIAFYGRLIDGDGTMPGNIFVVVSGYVSYDAFGFDYNSFSGTFFAVWHDSASSENVGTQISATGTPDSIFRVTNSGGTGNFNPRLAANQSRGEWLAATARSFNQIVGQRVQTDARATGGAPIPNPSPGTMTLTITKRGNGTVTAQGINCGTDCSESFAQGTSVRSTATPDTGYVFAGWYGDADCLDGVVVMDAARSCGAVFNKVLTTTSNRRSVDLSADGAGDQFLYNAATGDWFIAHNDQSSDFAYTRGRWDAGWEVKAAKLNSDSLMDLFLYNRTTGGWVQAINNGAGDFSITGGTWSADWNVYIGRFDSDSFDDVLLYNQTTGAMYECLANGTGGFKTYYSDTWSTGWSVFVARLDFFGVDDVFLYNGSTGRWARLFSNGDGTFIRDYGSWDGGWLVKIADMSGDGVDDIFLYNTTTGVWFQCLNTVTDFSYRTGQWSPGWGVFVANMNTDARDELFLYNSLDGVWFQAYPDGSGDFSRYVNGRFSPGWDVHVTELNADGVNDLFLYNQSTGQWFKCIVNPLGDFSTFTSGIWSADWRLVDR